MVHTPITDAGLDSLPAPDRVSCEIGTWMAMECTFSAAVALTPGAGLEKTFSPYWACSCSNGRRLARSKIEPRST